MADINIKITLGGGVATEAKTLATEAKTLATNAKTLATNANTQIRSLNSWKQTLVDGLLPLVKNSNSIKLYRKATKDNGVHHKQRLLVQIPKEIINFPVTFELWRYTRGKIRYTDNEKNTIIRDRRTGWTWLRKVNLKATRYTDEKDIHFYYDIRLDGVPTDGYKDLSEVFNGKIRYIDRDSDNIGEDMEVYNSDPNHMRINFFTGEYYKNRKDFGMKDGAPSCTKNNKLGIKVYMGINSDKVEIAFLPFSIVRQYSVLDTTDGRYLVPRFYIGRWS